MKEVLDHSASGLPATLFKIFQGSSSDFAIDFRTLAVTAGWGERDLHGASYHRLSDRILDELSTCELPTSLNGLNDLAICVDAHLAERRVACRVRHRTNVWGSRPPPSPLRYGLAL